MTAPDVFAAIFAIVYVLGMFLLSMGAAILARFAWEVLRND